MTKPGNKSFSGTFKIVLTKRKDCVKQLTRTFSGDVFQNCFNFEKSAWETFPCVCMRACKRVQHFESLLWSDVTLSHICQSVPNIFYETFKNAFLLQSSSIHQFGILYTYFVIRRVIILKLFKLMTYPGTHHTIIHCSRKKCCREVNKQRNTNNMLLSLLFPINRSVYLDMITTQTISYIKIYKWYCGY